MTHSICPDCNGTGVYDTGMFTREPCRTCVDGVPLSASDACRGYSVTLERRFVEPKHLSVTVQDDMIGPPNATPAEQRQAMAKWWDRFGPTVGRDASFTVRDHHEGKMVLADLLKQLATLSRRTKIRLPTHDDFGPRTIVGTVVDTRDDGMVEVQFRNEPYRPVSPKGPKGIVELGDGRVELQLPKRRGVVAKEECPGITPVTPRELAQLHAAYVNTGVILPGEHLAPDGTVVTKQPSDHVNVVVDQPLEPGEYEAVLFHGDDGKMRMRVIGRAKQSPAPTIEPWKEVFLSNPGPQKIASEVRSQLEKFLMSESERARPQPMPGPGQASFLIGRIKKIPGVSVVSIRESCGGLAVEARVCGGDQYTIAATIHECLGLGIGTIGSDAVQVKDRVIRFTHLAPWEAP